MSKALAIIGMPLLFAAGIGAGYLLFANPQPPANKGPNPEAKKEPPGFYTDDEVAAMRQKLAALSLPMQQHEVFARLGIDRARLTKAPWVKFDSKLGEVHWPLNPTYGIALYQEMGDANMLKLGAPSPATRIVIGKLGYGAFGDGDKVIEYLTVSADDKDKSEVVSFPAPALEFDSGASELAGRFGYRFLHVYRWRGGIPEGWVHFQTGEEPTKRDLGVAKVAKEMFDGRKMPYNPRAVSGVITIAIKDDKTDKSGGVVGRLDCDVGVNVTIQEAPMTVGGSQGFGYSLSGKIDQAKLWGKSIFNSGSSSLGGGEFFIGSDLAGKQPGFQVYELKKVNADGGK